MMALLISSLLLGCSKTETPTSTTTTTVTVQKMVLGWISNYGGQVILLSEPAPDTSRSNASISWGASKTSRDFQYKTCYSGYIVMEWEPDIDWFLYYPYHDFLDTVLTINVTSNNIDNSRGSIQLPGAVNIIAPVFYDTLPTTAATCIWSRSARADWYDIYYHFDLYDSLGNYVSCMGSKETFTTDTTYTIPASYFSLAGNNYYQGYFDCYPCSGPSPQANVSGNMTGTIKGFLVGEGGGEYAYFYVGTPPKGMKAPKIEHNAPCLKDRMNKYLQLITGR
jgi:hypothetical protein